MTVKQMRAALLALVADQTPTGAEDPECSRCHETVAVPPLMEWDDGDMCSRCTPEALDELRDKIRCLANDGPKP